jgi:G3E family GTPase
MRPAGLRGFLSPVMPEASGVRDLKRRIPVTLVTGFLGSGKTTLINAALRSPDLSRTIVVVNEFGEIGLDQKLFARSSDAVVILENGCLCCTVRGDLVGTLNSLFHSRQAGEMPWFDNVVIETSGLAEPGPVLQAFLSEPTLDGLYRVASVVTVVDAVNWADTAQEHDESVRQVALADQIRITKLDLLGNQREAEARIGADLRLINPSATIAAVDLSPEAVARLLTSKGFDAADPSADPRSWLDLAAHERTGDHHDHDHDQDDPGHDHHHHRRQHLEGKGIESFVLTREHPLSRDEAQFLLDGIASNLGTGFLRVKGLVNIAEEPGRPAVIQGAQHLLHTMTWLERWPDDDHRTRVVFITQGIPKSDLKEIVDLLDRVSARTFRARANARQGFAAAKSAGEAP